MVILHVQKDNIRNQRENVVLALANAQSRLGIPVGANPVSNVTYASKHFHQFFLTAFQLPSL